MGEIEDIPELTGKGNYSQGRWGQKWGNRIPLTVQSRFSVSSRLVSSNLADVEVAKDSEEVDRVLGI